MYLVDKANIKVQLKALSPRDQQFAAWIMDTVLTKNPDNPAGDLSFQLISNHDKNVPIFTYFKSLYFTYKIDVSNQRVIMLEVALDNSY